MIFYYCFIDYITKISVKIILRPRTFKYKKLHKIRRIRTFKNTPILKIGTSGLLLLKPIRLTSSHISKFKLFLKRAVRKVDRTRRFYWFNCFPFFPLTRKPIGARMGKGKGKAKKWYTSVPGGLNIVEFLNLRTGRAMYFMKQLTHKLGCPTAFLFSSFRYMPLPFHSSKKTIFRTWNQ